MDAFQWDDCFATGLPEVDAQHRSLFDLINRLGAALAGLHGPDGQTDSAATAPAAPGTDIEAIYAELASYTEFHFREEESLSRRIGVDERHAAGHRAQHRKFLEEVNRSHESMLRTDPQAGDRLLRFLIAWLAQHILGVDQSLARQLRAIEAGASPAAAYEAEQQVRQGALDPLTHALDSLFHLVSERNRELTEINHTLEERVAARTRELEIANRRLDAIAHTDALTGLPNRRHALAHLRELWERPASTQEPLSCMMIDADGFKRINDTYGHDAGDVVLRTLAHHLRDSLRSDDHVARMGGDEFLVVCANTALADALALAESLRATTALMRVAAGDGHWTGSISVGVAERRPTMGSIEDLIKAADEGVYRAKSRGRNCVASAQEGTA